MIWFTMLFIEDNQYFSLSICFILVIPRCPRWWTAIITFLWRLVGIMILFAQKIQSSTTKSLVLGFPMGCWKWQFFLDLGPVGDGGNPASCLTWTGEDDAIMQLVHKVLYHSSLGYPVPLCVLVGYSEVHTLALNMCGSRFSLAISQSWGFDWPTRREHHITGSLSGSSSEISSSIHYTNHFLSGSYR